MPLDREPPEGRNKSYDSFRHSHSYQTLIYAELSGLDVDSLLVCYITLARILG